jgi:O-methyltransferase involved in polyketide biosynthesis
MTNTSHQDLSAASETSLMAVYIRAMESQRPDALIKDKKAVALVAQMSDEFARFEQIPMSDAIKVMRNFASREYDRHAQDFLARHPDAVVVHIGCGLDSRFERVDNGQVEWYDLDLPEIIELRRKLYGDEGEHHHLLGCSVLEEAWLDTVSAHRRRPFLFMAEVVLVYFEGAQVKRLVLALRDRFPGAELVFDACSPLHVRVANRQASSRKLNARLGWGVWHGQEIEGWGDGIRLLDEWGFFDDPTPRLAHLRWLRPLEAAIRTSRIYHFQLGEMAG